MDLPRLTSAIVQALEELEASDKIQDTGSGEARSYSAGQCLIPVGDEAGWEAAVIDHHQAVVNAGWFMVL